MDTAKRFAELNRLDKSALIERVMLLERQVQRLLAEQKAE